MTGWVPAARVSEDSWSSDDGYEEGSGEWSEEEDQDNTPLFLAGMQGADTSPATASQASTEQTVEPEWHSTHLRPSLFPEGPKVVVFGLDAKQPLPPGLTACPPKRSHLTFKITQVGFRCVKSAFKSGGMKGLVKGSEWNGAHTCSPACLHVQ